MEAATATATRKRSSPDAAITAAGGKKRARVTFGNIYDYERLEVLGEGTYGVVLKALDRRTGETVAVKWLRGDKNNGNGNGGRANPDLRALFREAGCLAACRGHPNVVEVRDVAADAATGAAFLVTEFVGPSLRTLQHSRARGPRFSESETRVCMRQLLCGAARVHAAGLVHRDVKPDNVLVGPAGELKICDFGMATPARNKKPYADWWAGTPGYRAPEQLVGNPYYGPAVDMWALGCVMAELLTGEVLFHAEDEEGMLTMAMDMLSEFTESRLRAFDTLEAFRGLPLGMSLAGREVLAGLLNFDAGERLTAADALKHRWFTEDLAYVSHRIFRC